MRSYTSAEQNILELPNRANWFRVLIDRGSSDWVDLSSLETYNFCIDFTRTIAVDSNIAKADITLWKKVESLNLALLMDNSQLNASGTIVDIGNPIIIETATIPENEAPSSSDWREIFRGEIEGVNWGGLKIKINALDRAQELNATFIETQRVYGLAAGLNVEYAMQDLLDDNNPTKATLDGGNMTWQNSTTVLADDTSNMLVGDYIAYDVAPFFKIDSITPNTSVVILNPYSRVISNIGAVTSGSLIIPAATPWTLYTPNGTAATPINAGDRSGWNVTIWKQKKESLLQALSILSQQNGYDFRYSWHDGTSAFQFTIDRPPRGTASRGTLTLSDVPSVGEAIIINGVSITATAGTPTSNQFAQGSTVAAACKNIAFAVNNNSTILADVFAWKDTTTTVVFEWKTPGTAGDAITFTETMATAGSVDGAGFLGGTRAGAQGTSTVNWTFDDADYERFSNLSLDRANIRNVVKVVFTDKLGDDDRITSLVIKNAASIAKYGRKYMELTEASGSQIDSGSEAMDFAQAGLSDLKEPIAQLSCPLPYFWPVQLWDILRFSADGDHFDSDQDLSVVNIMDKMNAQGKAMTTVQTRGTPMGGVMRWLSIEGRPGVAPPIDIYSDDAAEGGAVTPFAGGFTVVYDDPRTMDPAISDWEYTECHVATTSLFTPDSSTLRAKGKQTRFEVGGLVPGDTYYIKLVIYDSQGNIATTSSQITTATQKVATYHNNTDTDSSNLIPNGDFGQSTFDLATTPPDGWELAGASTWGSSSGIYFSGTLQQTGYRSIHFRSTAGHGLNGIAYVPTEHKVLYKANLVVRADSITAGDTLTVKLFGYDEDQAYIGAPTDVTLLNSVLQAVDTWETYELYFYLSTGSQTVRWIRPQIVKAVGGGFNAYCDRLVFNKARQAFRAYQTSALNLSSGSFISFNPDTEEFDRGGDYNFSVYTVRQPGTYQFRAQSGLASLAANNRHEMRFQVIKASGTINYPVSTITTGTSGDSRIQGSIELDLVEGDTVKPQFKHNYGSNRAYLVGADESFFSGKRVE